tara:strand:- start:2492 stop:2908 length:417 start_codon:yes stop_codon:yes gene_type:complete
MDLGPLQQAIYDRLTGVPAVNDAVVGIYTQTPQNAKSEDPAAFPFITIGSFAPKPMDTDGSNGISALVDVHLWSRSTSALTWRAISSAVYDALHKYTALNVVGAQVVDCLFETGAEIPDPDDITTHSIVSFRVTYFTS